MPGGDQQTSVAVSFFRGSLTTSTDDVDLDDTYDYLITSITLAYDEGSAAGALVLTELDSGPDFFVLATEGGSESYQNTAFWNGEMLISGAGFHIFTSLTPALITISGYVLNPTADTVL